MHPFSSTLFKFCLSLACVLSVFVGTSHAHVGYYANCAYCHGSTTGVTALSGNLTAPTNLSVNPRLDGGNTSSLPCFTAKAGDVITVTLNSAPPGTIGDIFSFAVTGNVVSGSQSLSFVAGIKTSAANQLHFSIGGSSWAAQAPLDAGVYYSQGPLAWASGATTET